MEDRHKKMMEFLEKEDHDKKAAPLKINDRVLIVDSLNSFIRSFTIINHVNKYGIHIGGLSGYLKSLGYAINLVRPTRVILVFDGQGGSTNKRYLYPEYKANRGYRRVTNWELFDNQEQEAESITNQILRLIDYLKCLPVDLLSIDKIEADDVIGCLCNNLQGEVTIVSSDRDYLQLVNDRVCVYSPVKKKFYEPKDVLKEYGVTPQNFLMQKVITGDAGDNVPGVKGIGQKTLLKHYPELSGQEIYTLDEMLSKAKSNSASAYKKIVAFGSQLRINEKLMDLKKVNIPEDSMLVIEEVLSSPNKLFRPKDFTELYEEDDLGKSINNLQLWLFEKFHALSKYEQ
jgi:DNA polymerase-1